MIDRLREALAARAVPLSQRVLDRMYENPFWTERYGERGRRFANEDSLHHIGYLDQALAADDAAELSAAVTPAGNRAANASNGARSPVATASIRYDTRYRQSSSRSGAEPSGAPRTTSTRRGLIDSSFAASPSS